MMQVNKVTCDLCGADKTSTGNCVAWRLVLMPELIPSEGPMVTLMHVEPDLDRPYHFCGIQCLKKWLDSNYDKVTKRYYS